MFYTRGLHFHYYNSTYNNTIKIKLEKKLLFCHLLFLIVKIGDGGKTPSGYILGKCMCDLTSLKFLGQSNHWHIHIIYDIPTQPDILFSKTKTEYSSQNAH